VLKTLLTSLHVKRGRREAACGKKPILTQEREGIRKQHHLNY
jgi:hypothetical protein